MKVNLRLARVAGAILASGFCGLASALAQAQFPSHDVGPPTVPGTSELEGRADAFMAQNGYSLVPSLTHFGSMSRFSPGQDQLSLQPGTWAVAVLAKFDPVCQLAVTYRDVGYTPGTQVFQPQQGDGFVFIPLEVTSNLSGIGVEVRDAGAPGPGFRQCGYEYRFYRRG